MFSTVRLLHYYLLGEMNRPKSQINSRCQSLNDQNRYKRIQYARRLQTLPIFSLDLFDLLDRFLDVSVSGIFRLAHLFFVHL